MREHPWQRRRPPEWSFSIDLIKIRDWWLGRQRKKRGMKDVWVYECGCEPGAGYRDVPYCPIHGMKLIRKVVVDPGNRQLGIIVNRRTVRAGCAENSSKAHEMGWR